MSARWRVVALLTLAYILSFVDRQTLAVVAPLVQRDLAISDTEMSLLIGLAFSVFYAIIALPMGAAADRMRRTWLIAAAVAGWSVMTMLTGLARSYGELFASRIGLGIGEAVLGPAALSLISDYFAPEQRGRAISVYHSGIAIGSGLALVVGGWLASVLADHPDVRLVGDLTVHAWQCLFLGLAAPGVLLALALAQLREPVRPRDERAADDRTVRAAVHYLVERRRQYAPLLLAMSATTAVGYAYLAWVPSVFFRTWGWSLAQSGAWYGALLLTAGPLGAWCAGAYADVLTRSWGRAAAVRSAYVGVVYLFVWQSLMPLMPSGWAAAGVLVPASVAGPWVAAAGLNAVAGMTPAPLRGRVLAIYFLCISLLGGVAGPTAVTLVSDYVFRDPAQLGSGLAWATAAFGLVTFASLRRTLTALRSTAPVG